MLLTPMILCDTSCCAFRFISETTKFQGSWVYILKNAEIAVTTPKPAPAAYYDIKIVLIDIKSTLHVNQSRFFVDCIAPNILAPHCKPCVARATLFWCNDRCEKNLIHAIVFMIKLESFFIISHTIWLYEIFLTWCGSLLFSCSGFLSATSQKTKFLISQWKTSLRWRSLLVIPYIMQNCK